MNIAALLAEELGRQLGSNYTAIYGSSRPEYADLLRAMARVVVERMANSDALYHDARHTMMVTLVGQAILRGRLLSQHVTPEDWLHYTVATLFHDIGYLRGICSGDADGRYVVSQSGDTVTLPRGASDAALAPHHVERGKIFVRERLGDIRIIDTDRIARGIELTRFPVPDDGDHQDTGAEPGLVRAADLIGQLGDPYYPCKLNGLFREFQEIGVAQRLGYESPADLAEGYPRFFWGSVSPYIQDGIRHLDQTLEGKKWLAHLYSHVFVEEHAGRRAGPQRAHNAAGAAFDLPEPDEVSP